MNHLLTRLVRRASLVVIAWALASTSALQAGTYDLHYDFLSDWTLGAPDNNQRRLSVPRRNGVPVGHIRAVICSYPGSGASGNAGSPHASFARWAYENGYVFYSVGYPGSAPAETLSDLVTFSGAVYFNRPALGNAPLVVQGGSYGCSTAMAVADAYPERVAALYGYHKGSSGEPVFNRSVPAHISFGEMDSAYSDYNSARHAAFLAGWSAVGGAPRSFQFDRESAHTYIVDRPAHFQLFVDSIVAARTRYLPGTSGSDSALGPVELLSLDLAAGWRGEHLLTPHDPAGAAALSLPYALRSKDWDSPALHISPAPAFDRANPHMHSWFPDRLLALAWQSRAGLGARHMRLEFEGLPDSDAQDNTLRAVVLTTAQSASCTLSTGDFASATRVEFLDNGSVVRNDTLPPFEHIFSWNSGSAGWHVLQAVAVDDNTGERRVSACRILRVAPATSNGNTAPTIGRIQDRRVSVGTQTVVIPIAVGDLETSASALQLHYARESYRDDAAPHDETRTIAHTAVFAGAGSERTLNITLTDTSKTGVIWAMVQVSDGALETNAYLRINIVPTASQPPVFVPWRHLNSSYGTLGQVTHVGGWSRVISFRIHDPDTPASLLSVTASGSAGIPDSAIELGGTGATRTLRVRAASAVYSTVTLTVSDGVSSSVSQWRPTPVSLQEAAPTTNALGDVSTYVGEPVTVYLRPADLHSSADVSAVAPMLAVTADSEDQTLLPASGLIVGGAGHWRRIVCLPTPGLLGQTRVVVTCTDEAGLAVETAFRLNVLPASVPAFSSQPTGATVAAGAGAVLACATTGGNPKSFQWFRGESGDTSVPVAGARSERLVLSDLTDSARFWVRVTNAAGSTDSSAADIRVIHPPSFLEQPLSSRAWPGQRVQLQCAVAGEDLGLQWFEGESGDTTLPIFGATTTTLVVRAADTTRRFWVRATNLAGDVNSATARIEVHARSWVAYHDTITTPDGNAPNVTSATVAVAPGAQTSLLNFHTGAPSAAFLTSVLTGTRSAKTNGQVTPASGTDAYRAFNGIISFQSGTTHYSEQLGGSVSTANVRFTFSSLDPEARYSVALYAARNAFTTPNRYTLSGADSFLEGHSSGVGDAGDTDPATADVASGTGSTVNGYLVQWVGIAPGADGAFTVEVRTHSGTSFAIIPQAVRFEAFTNTPAAAEILEPPASTTVLHGAQARLEVVARGEALSYQWYVGTPGDASRPIAGATDAVLQTTPLTASESFWVRITNPGGVVDSMAALVTVEPPAPEILTADLGAWIEGEARGHRLYAWGGRPPLSWSVASGALPAGIELTPDGLLSGTPGFPGSAFVRIRVTDTEGAVGERVLLLRILNIDWTAFHDTQANEADGNAPNVTYGNTGDPNGGSFLRDFETGADLPVVIQINSTIGTNGGFKQLVPVHAVIGPDATSVFAGSLSFGVVSTSPNFWYPGVCGWDLGLDGASAISLHLAPPDRLYDIALFAARPLYDSRTQFTLDSVSAFTPLHSAGSLARSNSGDSVAFQTGAGALEAGRVARWTAVSPSALSPGRPDLRSFTVRISPLNPGGYPCLLPQGIRIRQLGTLQAFTAAPCITGEPVDQTLPHGEIATIRVEASGEGLTFRWLFSEDGVTFSPMPGEVAPALGVVADGFDRAYRVEVANAGGTMISRSAWVRTEGGPGDPYTRWASERGLPAGADDSASDPDGDGLPNLLEFAFGGDPLSDRSAPAPSVLHSGAGGIRLRFLRAVPWLVYHVEAREDLSAGAWNRIATLASAAEDSPSEVSGPEAAVPPGGRLFMRVVVETP